MAISTVTYCALANHFYTVITVQSQPGVCHGMLQSSPADYLGSAAEMLVFSENNTMYLYTSLLEGSGCGSGSVKEFSFCYKPSCSDETSTGKPAFYVLLLLYRGTDYFVAYIHEELEDQIGSCGDNSSSSDISSSTCKSVSLDSSMPVTVNSSYSIAFIIPGDASDSYLYEAESTSQGVISSPPPQVPQVGGSLELVEGTSRQISDRLFQIVLEAAVSVFD